MRRTTAIIGYMIKNDDEIFKAINMAIEFIKEKYAFVQKDVRSLHTTLLYLGNQFSKRLYDLINTNGFLTKMNQFNHVTCVFDKLEFIGRSLIAVYKFTDDDLNVLHKSIIKDYENYEHSEYKHITLGSFESEGGSDGLDAFSIDDLDNVSEILKDKTFVIDSPTFIKIKKDIQDKTFTKNYTEDKKLCDIDENFKKLLERAKNHYHRKNYGNDFFRNSKNHYNNNYQYRKK